MQLSGTVRVHVPCPGFNSLLSKGVKLRNKARFCMCGGACNPSMWETAAVGSGVWGILGVQGQPLYHVPSHMLLVIHLAVSYAFCICDFSSVNFRNSEPVSQVRSNALTGPAWWPGFEPWNLWFQKKCEDQNWLWEAVLCLLPTRWGKPHPRYVAAQ